MAQSPSHTFGQLLGAFLEELVEAELRPFCAKRGLFLDRHGKRVGVRQGLKLTWPDDEGNTHDLDFVIERDAAPAQMGKPVAFVESAWRSYTKHSKAKAQEIQGAVLPVVDSLEGDRPFIGAILAGNYSKSSLLQLQSVGFVVAHLERASVVSAFRSQEVDIDFVESTSDAVFARCVAAIRAMSPKQRQGARASLAGANRAELDGFLEAMARKLDRQVESCAVTLLYGREHGFATLTDLRHFLQAVDSSELPPGVSFDRLILLVRYTNGDRVECSFSSAQTAVGFLANL